jgi:ubiquitin carboxyl-terminal hydrolase 7
MLTSKSSVETLNLTKSFGWDSRDVFTQQDVQEFSCILLDVIEKKVEKPSHPNFIKDIFCGKMLNYIKCTKVEFESVREETFYDIQLPVKGFKDIYASLKDYTQEEDLNGDNQYDTVKFGKQDAKKGIKFKELPKVLFFHLRRFEYDVEQDENVKVVFLDLDSPKLSVLRKP